MTEQMLNVSNGSTSIQQASGKGLSQIVRGNISDTSPLNCSVASLWEAESGIPSVWRAW
jgi:hypothetical protein